MYKYKYKYKNTLKINITGIFRYQIILVYSVCILLPGLWIECIRILFCDSVEKISLVKIYFILLQIH